MFDLESETVCGWDAFTIYDTNGTRIHQFCGQSLKKFQVVSSGPSLRFHFKTDSVQEHSGFLASWEEVDAEFTIDDADSEGVYLLSFPGSFLEETPDKVCVEVFQLGQWTIETSVLLSGEKIWLKSPVVKENIKMNPNETNNCFSLTIPKSKQDKALLNIKMKRNNNLVVDEYKTINLLKTEHYPLIQTDKGQYKAGDRVKYRLMIVDHDLLPVPLEVEEIWVEDPRSRRIAQWKNKKLNKGMLQEELTLSREPELGTWTINVKAGSIRESAQFQVAEYVLPKFQVEIKPPQAVLKDDKQADWEVCATYTHGGRVKGMVKANFSSNFIDFGYNCYGNYPGACRTPPPITKNFTIDVKMEDGEDCAILTLIQEQIKNLTEKVENFQLEVEFVEEGTNTIEKAEWKGDLFDKAFLLEIGSSSTEFIVGGFPYTGQFKVTNHDGTARTDEKLEVCVHLYKDIEEIKDELSKRGIWSMSEAEMVEIGHKMINIEYSKECHNIVSDDQGEINFHVPLEFVPDDIKKLSLKVVASDFLDNEETGMRQPSQLLDVVLTHSKLDLSLSLREKEREKVKCGEKMTARVFFSSYQNREIDLFYHVMAKGTIVKSGNLKVNIGEDDVTDQLVGDFIRLSPFDSKNLSKGQGIREVTVKDVVLDIDHNLSPSLQLVIFVNDGNSTLTDSHTYQVESCQAHTVTVEWSETKVYPGTEVNLKVGAESGSLCALSATDKSVDLLGNNNKVTKEELAQLMVDISSRRTGLSSWQIIDQDRCPEAYKIMQVFESTGIQILTDLHFVNSCPSIIDSLNNNSSSGGYRPQPAPVAIALEEVVPQSSFISGAVEPVVEERDPCVPNPCGQNSNAPRQIGDRCDCSCLSGMLGSPPNCRPECIFNQDCPTDKACKNQKCIDPCPGLCGVNANCRVRNHIPICVCNTGYYGDPFSQCRLITRSTTPTPPPATTTYLPGAVASSLPGGALAAGIGGASPVNKPKVALRNYFPETWLFYMELVDDEGVLNRKLESPHTITTWSGEAICMSDKVGLGAATPANLQVNQDFFAELRLPSFVKRGEVFPLNVSVYNYLETVELPMVVELVSEGLSTDISVYKVCVKPKDNTVIEIPATATDLGKVNVTVKATISNKVEGCTPVSQGEGFSDALVKPLTVKPEGLPVEIVESDFKCIETGEDEEFKISKLQLPENLVEGSERAWVEVTGDIMAPALENVGNLVRLPTGCGEQNMVGLVPNIYLLQYLDSVKLESVDSGLIDKAKEYMEIGYRRQQNYHHPNGAYSIWGDKGDKDGSSWLTAFVVKSFSEASQYIEVSDSLVQGSVDWLLDNQLENGCFAKRGYVHSSYLKGAGSDNSLTPFIVTALLEAKTRMDINIPDRKLVDGVKCMLKENNSTDLYSTIVTAHAATLLLNKLAEQENKSVKSLKKLEKFVDQWKTEVNSIVEDLESRANTSLGDAKFWDIKEDTPKWGWGYYSSSKAVEMTAYMVLVRSLRGELGSAVDSVKWLARQRNSQGGFVSTQDTVVGLQAISEYSQKASRIPLSLSVDLSEEQKGAPIKLRTFTLKPKNSLLLQTEYLTKLPSSVLLDTSGSGCAVVQTVLRYNTMESQPDNGFNIKADRIAGENKLHICSKYTGGRKETGMVLMEVEMVSGWKTISPDNLINEVDSGVQRVETEDDKVILYFDSFLNDDKERCVDLDLVQVAKVENRKAAVVKIYDYYNKQENASNLYNI